MNNIVKTIKTSRSKTFPEAGITIVEWDVAELGEFKPAPTHHIVVLDCSGSMSGSTSQMREQLKNKVVKLIKRDDLLTIIWFSGRNEHGAIISGQPVAALSDLQAVHEAIDRWIAPVGLTGFVGPITDVAKIIEQVEHNRAKQKKGPIAHSLFFMTDGMDNQWDRESILKALKGLTNKISASTFVEYGYYVDRGLLSSMASTMGGTLIYARDFDRFQPVLEAAIRPTSLRELAQIDYGRPPLGGVVFGFDEAKNLVTYNEKLIDRRCRRVFAVFEHKGRAVEGNLDEDSSIEGLYLALSVLAMRGDSESITKIHRALGDVQLIKEGSALFGKQDFERFAARALEGGRNYRARFKLGRDVSVVPKDDAYCILDMLDEMQLAGVRFDLDRLEGYSAISRKRLDATDTGFEQLQFKADANPEGFDIDGLVYNENRANLSIRVLKEGTVDLQGRMPFSGSVPNEFRTHVYRNYALVADGQVHIEKLPIVFDEVQASHQAFIKKLDALGAVSVGKDHAVIDTSALPILNRVRVKSFSASEIFRLQWVLEQRQAVAKVLKYFYEAAGIEKPSPKFEALYGAEAAAWLKAQGITEDGGYKPPKTKQAQARDYYLAKELVTKVQGLSSLPPVEEAIERYHKFGDAADNGKTASDHLMFPTIHLVLTAQKTMDSSAYKAWITESTTEAIKASRDALKAVAMEKFAIIVSGSWFNDLPGQTIGLGGKTIQPAGYGEALKFSIEAREKKIEI